MAASCRARVVAGSTDMPTVTSRRDVEEESMSIMSSSSGAASAAPVLVIGNMALGWSFPRAPRRVKAPPLLLRGSWM